MTSTRDLEENLLLVLEHDLAVIHAAGRVHEPIDLYQVRGQKAGIILRRRRSIGRSSVTIPLLARLQIQLRLRGFLDCCFPHPAILNSQLTSIRPRRELLTCS